MPTSRGEVGFILICSVKTKCASMTSEVERRSGRCQNKLRQGIDAPFSIRGSAHPTVITMYVKIGSWVFFTTNVITYDELSVQIASHDYVGHVVWINNGHDSEKVM